MYCSTLPADAVRKTRGLKKFLKKLFGASLCVYNVHCLVVNLKGEKHVKNNQKKKSWKSSVGWLGGKLVQFACQNPSAFVEEANIKHNKHRARILYIIVYHSRHEICS